MHLRAHKPALVAPAALSIGAWLSLFALEQSRYGQMAGHAAGHGLPIGHGGAQGNGPLLFFAAGWALMVVAMMVPAVLPFMMQVSASIAPIGRRAGVPAAGWLRGGVDGLWRRRP
jgi:predicted metal-binding membrane protein